MPDLKPGTRIELIFMPNDPQPLEPGSRGTVTYVDLDPRHGSIGVEWDNGRRLNLVPGVDQFRILG